MRAGRQRRRAAICFAVVSLEHRTPNSERPTPTRIPKPHSKMKDRTGIVDIIAEDTKNGEVVLVMDEPDEWDGSDEQLLALQERFNTYVSFLLDGEMAETHPEFSGKIARIELRCAKMPDTRTLELLGLIHDRLTFQEIKLEVVVRNKATKAE
jgi:hypothetical protein